MSQQALSSTVQPDDQAHTAANVIRQSIAHFFANDDDDAVIAKITDHTLRDIGVDPTVYNYL